MHILPPSEFILNQNGSIYHLDLLPENLAPTVITVGDPDRVDKVTQYFDTIEFSVRKREFHTQTGYYKGKRISVISTGIGTDNIDIVLNELDALVNIDFESRQVKKEHQSLDIIRIGTSGSIQDTIPVDSFVLSEVAVGFDSLLHFYKRNADVQNDFEEALSKQLELYPPKGLPYVSSCSPALAEIFKDESLVKGITATNVGFYGPQGRVLRLELQDEHLNDKLARFEFKGRKITNLEMETAGIYGLSGLLGHRALSLNAIVANRATNEFSSNSSETIDSLIRFTLNKLLSY